MLPIAAGHQVAEPLVREFVRDERIAREVDVRGLVVERAVRLRRRARILHAAEDEVGDGDLRVARVRIRNADLLLESFDHLRRVGEGAFAVALVTRQNVVVDGNAVAAGVALLHLDERSRDHRHEVGAVRYVLAIPEDRVPVLVPPFHQLAVAQRKHPFGNDDRRRRALLLVRVVQAWEPVPRVLILALRPDVRDLFRVFCGRFDEEQAVAGLRRTIGHRKACAFARGNRLLEDDFELTVACAETRRGFDARNLEVDRVERQARNRLVERADRERADAVERLRFEVGSDVKIDLFDLDDLVGSEMRTCAGQGKSLMFAPLVRRHGSRAYEPSVRLSWDYSAAVCRPPVTSITVPVTKSRSCAMKNRTASATSS